MTFVVNVVNVVNVWNVVNGVNVKSAWYGEECSKDPFAKGIKSKLVLLKRPVQPTGA